METTGYVSCPGTTLSSDSITLYGTGRRCFKAECPDCEGKGKRPCECGHGEVECETCHGTGKVDAWMDDGTVPWQIYPQPYVPYPQPYLPPAERYTPWWQIWPYTYTVTCGGVDSSQNG